MGIERISRAIQTVCAIGMGRRLSSSRNCNGTTDYKVLSRVQTLDHSWISWRSVREFADAASPAGGDDSSKKASGSGSKSAGGGNSTPNAGGITEAYRAAWKKVAPRIDIHKTPSDFMKPRPASTSALPTKLTVNFVVPYETLLRAKEVDMVIVPATTGMMGVLAGHVPTIAELGAGLLTVHDGTDVQKFFISSGFAIVHANSVADLLAVEAVTLDNLDIEEARKGLAEYTQKQSSATTDLDKAEAQIAIEVYGAIVATMT